MTESTRAVFVSYASQDAEAAARLCAALRTAGIEVWFDRSELRGGDAWDRQIRSQIRDCRLFLAVISAQTESRDEGYFRREWKLAVERTADLAADVPFMLPVTIDNTGQATARVPDEFLRVQWTHLPAGVAGSTFVERVAQLLSAGSRTRAASMPPVPAARRTARRPRALYGALTLVAGLAMAGYLGMSRLHPSRGGGASSIAVLPLTNESGDAGQQYFSDGISEDLITALSQVPGLKVIGRTSAFQFRDSKEDSRSIGAKLGVAHLLEGSVRRSGDVVRVSAELIDTVDGSTQWSERYDRPYKDLFELQDTITHAVAGALRTKLLPGAQSNPQNDRPPGGSLDAYNALLQARFHFSRNTESDLRRSIDYCTQAVALEPRYAMAWSLLAKAWTSLGAAFLEGAAAQEAYAKARDASAHALAADPGLSAAHLAHGMLLSFVDFDWRASHDEYRRALELAPNDSDAIGAIGGQLAIYGELDAAVDLTRKAMINDPLEAQRHYWLSAYLGALGRLDEAEQVIRRAIELQPAGAGYHVQLAVIEILRGNAEAALTAANLEPPGPWRDTGLVLARQIGPDRTDADAALKGFIANSAAIEAYQIAEVFALRDDAKGTFDWLDRAWANHDPGIQTLLADPFLLRFRNDPRFAAFCHKVRLPAPGETLAL